MYRILIAIQEMDAFEQMNAQINWQSMNYHAPTFVSTADEAISAMETKRVDCIAYVLPKEDARKLNDYLTRVRPSLPIFQIKRNLDSQLNVLRDLLRLLDRLHSDMSDEIIDENVVLDMLRDELGHTLLAGEIRKESTLRGRLDMLRSHISPDKRCVMYDFDMPQGEVYLMNQWHYGSERLENALRTNFFGRYYDDMYYTVAVLTPRHIRVLACQRKEGKDEAPESLVMRADVHVSQAVENIKEYLGLDLILTDTQVLDNLIVLTQETV